MGIHGLMKLIGDYAPSAMKDGEIKTYLLDSALTEEVWVMASLNLHLCKFLELFFKIVLRFHRIETL